MCGLLPSGREGADSWAKGQGLAGGPGRRLFLEGSAAHLSHLRACLFEDLSGGFAPLTQRLGPPCLQLWAEPPWAAAAVTQPCRGPVWSGMAGG